MGNIFTKYTKFYTLRNCPLYGMFLHLVRIILCRKHSYILYILYCAGNIPTSCIILCSCILYVLYCAGNIPTSCMFYTVQETLYLVYYTVQEILNVIIILFDTVPCIMKNAYSHADLHWAFKDPCN